MKTKRDMEKVISYNVAEAPSENGFGWDPADFSSGGSATCPFCGTIAEIGYVKLEGCSGRIGEQPLAIVTRRTGKLGRVYLGSDGLPKIEHELQNAAVRTERLIISGGVGLPDEAIEPRMTGGICIPYGLETFGKLFNRRQQLLLLACASIIRRAHGAMNYAAPVRKAVLTYLGTALDRLAENSSNLCRWNAAAEKMQGTFGRQALAMVWDYCEANPFGGSVGDWMSLIALQINAINGAPVENKVPTVVTRGSAMDLPWSDELCDAIITDPPYYDNIDYAKLADFFYVWMKRSIGFLYPEHFGSTSTPKKNEAVADPVRHGRSRQKAKCAYEEMMALAFAQAYRVLKPTGCMTVVYA
ncbi:MAG: DUF1156 domain-containing protein, partial [Phycisphaerae bacterium]